MQANEAYLIVILLSRVITQLGDVAHINPKVIEGLYAIDLAYLQEFYNQINRTGTPQRPGAVPAVRARVRGGADRRGGS